MSRLSLINWKLCKDNDILNWMIDKYCLDDWKIKKIKEILKI